MAFDLNLIPISKRSTPNDRHSRLKICQECPHRMFNPPLLTCKKCGCAMGFKTWLKAAKCPEGKW